jgi:hypothetical protein
MSEVYSIINIEKYAEYVRKKAAMSYAENYDENLDEFITIGQVYGLIDECSIGRDEDGNYLISEEGYDDLYEAIQKRIYNCGLSKLAAAGHLECAWDEDKNEIVFWSSDSKGTG